MAKRRLKRLASTKSKRQKPATRRPKVPAARSRSGAGRRPSPSVLGQSGTPAVSKPATKKKPIESYDHTDKQRANNPPVGLVTPATDPDAGKRKSYQYDPHLDPQLVWTGKAEHTSFEVPTVSLHVHERIDPRTIIEAVRKRNGNGGDAQMLLFEQPHQNPPLREAIEFYKHAKGWTNRLIAGDSLLVMNSLLEKEGMAGKVQMVYIDPPYGIRYGSNFQPFVNKRDVKDGKDDDLTQEPEMIRAFRDTWELGIHSYLTYLRDRLLLARDLLHESGSCFVQIGDENLHLVRQLMDEVFKPCNFVLTIVVKKKGSTTPTDPVNDFVIWFAKDRLKLRPRRLYFERREPHEDPKFNTLISPNGEMRRAKDLSKDDLSSLTEAGWKWARVNYPIVSQHPHERRGRDFLWRNKAFSCGRNAQWRFDVDEAMPRLGVAERLFDGGGASLGGVLYWDDWPYVAYSNLWDDLHGEQDIVYVVQTNRKIVQRCLLMTTDPGDLVLDPTCGSGTTAFVAEQSGRRWVTCDTSRVSIALAKQRLMTALYDYYELAHPDEGVGSGFKYKTVPHVTLKSIANNPEIKEGMSREAIDAAIAKYADQETLYDQPFVDKSKARVSGPFTVEAVPAPSVRSVDSGQGIVDSAETPPASHDSLSTNHFAASESRSGLSLRHSEWRDELLKCGIRGKAGQHIHFSRVEPFPATRWLHADAETQPSPQPSPSKGEGDRQRVVVSFGPEHAPLEQRQVAAALEEAQLLVPKPGMVVFASFQFDPEAAKDIDETHWPGITLLKVQMNTDLLTDDLKKKRASNESFWMIGQPDVVVDSEEWLVDSRKEVVAPYAVVAELSGSRSLAEINDLGRDRLSLFLAIAQRGDLWPAVATDAGGGVRAGQHRRGPGEARNGGVPALSGRGSGLPGRIGDARDFVRKLAVLSAGDRAGHIERLRGSREIADRARQIAASLTARSPLSTIHYSQVTVQGFDYYNPLTGAIESGDTSKIAMWMLDTDYDGRSLYPRQVFFPMAGPKDGWARLAKNLKAEIDEDLIEAYRGTVSLPFEPGAHKRAAVKIIDDRGIESLKIVEVG